MVDRPYIEAEGLPIRFFKGVISTWSTYDMVDYHHLLVNGSRPHLTEQHVKAVFEKSEADFLAASPTHFLDNLRVLIFIMSHANMSRYTSLLEEKIREETDFYEVDLLYVHTLSHADLWRPFSFEAENSYRDMMTSFIFCHTSHSTP